MKKIRKGNDSDSKLKRYKNVNINQIWFTKTNFFKIDEGLFNKV